MGPVTLDSDTTLEIVLGEAADAELRWVVYYNDVTEVAGKASYTTPMRRASGATNGTTPVTALAAPGVGVTRQCWPSVCNTDDIAHLVQWGTNDGTLTVEATRTLDPGKEMKLTDDGWKPDTNLGPKGDPGGFVVDELEFAYGDATPELIGTAFAGKTIISVQLLVTQAFDGTSPSLTIGDAGNNSRLMASSDNDPATVGQYETHPVYAYGSDTAVKLYITPGAGATQGRGLVVITYES